MVILRRFRAFVWLVFLWLFVAHVALWRGSSFEAIQLGSKFLLGQARLSEQVRWGELCRERGFYRLGLWAFQRILAKNSENLAALGGSASSLAHLKSCDESKVYFSVYFSLGGNSPDVLRQSAVCLLQRGDTNGARRALYQSVIQEPQDEEGVETLVRLLSEEGRLEEALSALASVTGGDPFRSDRYRGLVLELQEQWTQSPNSKRAVRLPDLGSGVFYSPLRLSAVSDIEFFELNPATPSLKVFSPILRAVAQGVDRVELSQIQVGPWILRDITAEPQNERTGKLGASVLKHFDVYEEVEGGIRFLILFPL